MSSSQRVIKYLALAFAVFLTVNIIAAIATGFFAIAGIGFGIGMISSEDNTVYTEETRDITQIIDDIDINLSVSKLNIKRGNTFRVEAKNVPEDFLEVKDNVLKIKDEKKWDFFGIGFQNKVSEITIYIPENITFNNVNIDTGVGESKIQDLESVNIKLKLGIGKVEISNISSLRNTRIEGGVGEVEISDSILNDLRLNTGVGKFTLESELTGTTDIDAGIGELIVKIIGDKDDYEINADVGIGQVRIDGQKYSKENTTYGKGTNIVKINGGIGSIIVEFKEKINTNLQNNYLTNNI